MLDMLALISWPDMKEKFGNNKDWENKTCGCGYSISCICGWRFTACLLLENDGTPLKQEVTECPYCGTICDIFATHLVGIYD